MRIAQLLPVSPSEYDAKSQRIDFLTLAAAHEVKTFTITPNAMPPIDELRGFDLAHVYGVALTPGQSRALPIRFVATTSPLDSRWPWLRARKPAAIVTPLTAADASMISIPEAVEEPYFDTREATPHEQPIVGFCAGKRPLRDVVQLTMHRVQRTHDQIVFHQFDGAPSPDDLADVDLWVDFAIAEDDFDGCVAEAIAAAKPVIATRTAINVQRLEKGGTGFLIPAADPNEMTHAILAALFKPELSEARRNAARQTASKFRTRQRARALLRLYESLIDDPNK
jgi:hypothetical protein